MSVAFGGAIVLAGLAWFFGGDPPEQVDIQQAAAAVATSTPVNDPSAGIEGVWQVDTGVGTFNFEEATASFVGFRVDEELANIGAVTAVGRTPSVAGSIEIEGSTLVAASIDADLRAIVSDRSRRDDAIQRALGTSSNPIASFILSEPIELGAAASAGDPLTVTAMGDLTINGVTQVVQVPLESRLVDGRILVGGSVDIVFADYGVDTPTAPVVLSVEDHGILEIQLWFSRA
jgi:polyisoprenoid-binding protein YceI